MPGTSLVFAQKVGIALVVESMRAVLRLAPPESPDEPASACPLAFSPDDATLSHASAGPRTQTLWLTVWRAWLGALAPRQAPHCMPMGASQTSPGGRPEQWTARAALVAGGTG